VAGDERVHVGELRFAVLVKVDVRPADAEVHDSQYNVIFATLRELERPQLHLAVVKYKRSPVFQFSSSPFLGPSGRHQALGLPGRQLGRQGKVQSRHSPG
jgi:hypothetical protein